MENNYTLDKEFNKIDFDIFPLKKGNYENCTFTNCSFVEADLSQTVFDTCRFIACDMSMAKVSQTAFRNVVFKDTKMLGIDFSICHKIGLSFSFENCMLNLASFYQTKIKKSHFENCQLHEVDFVEADLSEVVFNHCDLLGAKFEQSILEKTDFRTAYNYTIDPNNNRLKKTKFSTNGILGLLDSFDIVVE